MKKNEITLLMCSLVILTSCGKNPKMDNLLDKNSDINFLIIRNESKNGDWNVSERMTRDREVYFKEESLPNDQVGDIVKREYKNKKMTPLPINPRFNTKLFRIDVEANLNSVFIAPKIYYLTDSKASRIQPLINEDDGSMTLFFPIMLIDGLNESVSSLNSQNESIKIPKNLLVQDTAELNTLINKNFASFGEQKLARLPGCPKEFIMEVDGKKFNITSDILKKSDYCDYNVPINASIKLPKEKAIWLMQKSLYSSGVYLSALFETRVPYTVSKFSIEMNKSKLHEEVLTKLSFEKAYTESEVKTEVTKIVKNLAMQISIQSNMNEHLTSIANQAIEQFFEKINADSSKAETSCGISLFCFKLNNTKFFPEEKLSANWVKTSDILSGQDITAQTKLVPLSDANVLFENLKNNNVSKSTGLVLIKDDILELSISKIDLIKYSQNNKTTLIHNNVQVGSTSHRECKNSENDGNNGPGGRHSKPVCQTVTVPTFQDHWIEETVLSALPNSEIINNPIGRIDNVMDDMMFGFSWFENGKEITKECPANSFQREKNEENERILLRITNLPGCEIFKKNSINKPKLYLINKARPSTSEIREGKVIKKHNGEIINSTWSVDSEAIDSYTGEVSIKGYRIGNSEELIFDKD